MRTENSSTSSMLDRLREETVQAYADGDADRAADLYVERGVQQPPGRSAAVGRDAIRASYQGVFARGGLTLRMDPWETVVTGREARERGAYRLAAGERELLVGKYMAVLAELDGEWRYVWTTVTPG